MKAIRMSDGSEVKPGEIIPDFRGDNWKFLSIVEGHKLYVEDLKDPSWHRIFFPSVFNLRVEE